MPWIYILELTERINSGIIARDWYNAFPSQPVSPVEDERFVLVFQAGLTASILTPKRNPGFEDFASMSYVASIQEWASVPFPGEPTWEPPFLLHPSGSIISMLDKWLRPVLSTTSSELAADGLQTVAITATFADPAYTEMVAFSIDGGPAMQVQATNGRAQLTFGPVEVPGIYEIACNSPMYGINRITVEAI